MKFSNVGAVLYNDNKAIQVFFFVISLVVITIVEVSKESPAAVRTQGYLILFSSPFPYSEV